MDCISKPFFKVIINSEYYKYSNKMALKLHLYLYLCYFLSTNIFGYSFGMYVAFKYTRIFLW